GSPSGATAKRPSSLVNRTRRLRGQERPPTTAGTEAYRPAPKVGGPARTVASRAPQPPDRRQRTDWGGGGARGVRSQGRLLVGEAERLQVGPGHAVGHLAVEGPCLHLTAGTVEGRDH